MATKQRKTRSFKNKFCRLCNHADKAKFRQGRPCCPFPNPQISNGHCVPFESKNPKKKEVTDET